MQEFGVVRAFSMDDVCYMLVSVYRYVVIQLGLRNKQVIQLGKNS
jgi:hypothetical protein